MPSLFRKWAETPRPLEDESLSSWMIRVDLANVNSLSSLINYIQMRYLDSKKYSIYLYFDLNLYSDI